MVTVSGNPNPTNPTNPTYPTNPTTKYRSEFGTLFCIYATQRFSHLLIAVFKNVGLLVFRY